MKSFIRKHPVIMTVAFVAAGVLSVVGGIGIIYDLHEQEQSAAAAQVETLDDQSMESQIDKYMRDDFAREWVLNDRLLRESKQHITQTLERTVADISIAKTAAVCGELTLTVYNIQTANAKESYDKQELESFLNQAFSRLGISLKVFYNDVPASQKLEELVTTRTMDDVFGNSVTIDLTAEGTKQEQILPIDQQLELDLGSKYAKPRGEGTGVPGNETDLIVVVGDFEDDPYFAGIALEPLTKIMGKHIFVDKSNVAYGALDQATVAFVIGHETAHRLGLRHTSNPLDIMSYAPKGQRLVKIFPEIAFSPESVSAWEAEKKQYVSAADTNAAK